MMNALNKNSIQKLIRNLHGNSLDDTAVQRIADSITSISSTLEGAGGLPTSFQLIGRPFAEEMFFASLRHTRTRPIGIKKHQRYDSHV